MSITPQQSSTVSNLSVHVYPCKLPDTRLKAGKSVPPDVLPFSINTKTSLNSISHKMALS